MLGEKFLDYQYNVAKVLVLSLQLFDLVNRRDGKGSTLSKQVAIVEHLLLLLLLHCLAIIHHLLLHEPLLHHRVHIGLIGWLLNKSIHCVGR